MQMQCHFTVTLYKISLLESLAKSEQLIWKFGLMQGSNMTPSQC